MMSYSIALFIVMHHSPGHMSCMCNVLGNTVFTTIFLPLDGTGLYHVSPQGATHLSYELNCNKTTGIFIGGLVLYIIESGL